LYNVDDEGLQPILQHESGIISLSDAGAHLGFLCDAGYGLYFLGHWVRKRGNFSLAEGVRRLTSQPADLYRIPDRGRIALGAHADLLLFDPATVGVSAMLHKNDMPGGAARTLRDPKGVHGLWVNGTRVFAEDGCIPLKRGPGAVLERFT
jgi:N-acyl-D-aspartate/D-glutamate deacylase